MRLIPEKRDEIHALPLIDVGTYGLHTVQSSFENSLRSSVVKIDKNLKWMSVLLASYPNRRETYQKVIGGAEFPVSFCD